MKKLFVLFIVSVPAFATASMLLLCAPYSSTTFTPSSIAGLQLWLDASDASTVHFASGSNVNQWDDKSGNSNNATAVTGGYPVYSSTGLQGSLPALTQSGAPQFMTLNSPIGGGGGNSILTVGFVGQKSNVAIDQVFIGPMFFVDTAAIYIYDDHGPEADFAPISTVNNTKFFFLVVANGTPNGTTAYMNGTALTRTAGGTGTYAWALQYIAKRHNAAGYEVSGAYSEYVVYNSALGSTDITSLTTYEKTKWGIP